MLKTCVENQGTPKNPKLMKKGHFWQIPWPLFTHFWKRKSFFQAPGSHIFPKRGQKVGFLGFFPTLGNPRKFGFQKFKNHQFWPNVKKVVSVLVQKMTHFWRPFQCKERKKGPKRVLKNRKVSSTSKIGIWNEIRAYTWCQKNRIFWKKASKMGPKTWFSGFWALLVKTWPTFWHPLEAKRYGILP